MRPLVIQVKLIYSLLTAEGAGVTQLAWLTSLEMNPEQFRGSLHSHFWHLSDAVMQLFTASNLSK